jgi:hypothetical protein
MGDTAPGVGVEMGGRREWLGRLGRLGMARKTRETRKTRNGSEDSEWLGRLGRLGRLGMARKTRKMQVMAGSKGAAARGRRQGLCVSVRARVMARRARACEDACAGACVRERDRKRARAPGARVRACTRARKERMRACARAPGRLGEEGEGEGAYLVAHGLLEPPHGQAAVGVAQLCRRP